MRGGERLSYHAPTPAAMRPALMQHSARTAPPSMIFGQQQQRGSAAAAALAALLLFAPVHDMTPLLPSTPAAQARELASGSGSKVNKDPLSLLRLGLPNQPKAMRDVQLKLEETDDQLGRLLPQQAKAAIDAAKGTLKGKSKEIAKAVPGAKALARGLVWG